LDFFILRAFDLCFAAVNLVRNVRAHNKVGGIHRFARISTAGVAFSSTLEEEIIGLMLVLLVFDSIGLGIFESCCALDFISSEGGQADHKKESGGQSCFLHGSPRDNGIGRQEPDCSEWLGDHHTSRERFLEVKADACRNMDAQEFLADAWIEGIQGIVH
jgi:hypothetical protein